MTCVCVRECAYARSKCRPRSGLMELHYDTMRSPCAGRSQLMVLSTPSDKSRNLMLLSRAQHLYREARGGLPAMARSTRKRAKERAAHPVQKKLPSMDRAAQMPQNTRGFHAVLPSTERNGSLANWRLTPHALVTAASWTSCTLVSCRLFWTSSDPPLQGLIPGKISGNIAGALARMSCLCSFGLMLHAAKTA